MRIITALTAGLLVIVGGGCIEAAEGERAIIHVSAAGTKDGDGSEARPMASLAKALGSWLKLGRIILIDEKAGPLVEDVAMDCFRAKPGEPIVIRAKGQDRAILRGRLLLLEVRHIVLKRLAIEPRPGDANDKPCVTIAGADVDLRDVTIRAATGDGLNLEGDRISVRGGEVAACEGRGVVARGSVRIDGLRVASCRQGALHLQGEALVSNCLLLHNRGPALTAEKDAGVRFYHNLVYDNSGGVMLDACREARVLNNIFVNNFAATLLGEQDVELSVPANAQVDHNVYSCHPGKDKLLRGLPYAEGVDLAPLRAGNPFGLRLRVGGQIVTSLSEKSWAERFDAHSQSLDILPRLTGRNSYTRSYEDLFADFQQEDFRPRYTSPSVGRGADLTADVPVDCLGRPRAAKHPDIGPYAAPVGWWSEIDAGRATIVDGSVGLDADGRDRGMGTARSPFATLAKAAAFARFGSRIYVKDSIYRDTAMQTTFSLGPDSLLSGFPGHRPVFSPSDFIESERWEQVAPEGLYRIRDWHTFLGANCRLNAWMQDFYGNSHLGGPDENKTSLCRNRAVGHVSNVPRSRRLGLRPDPGSVGTESQPTSDGRLETCPTFRPIRHLALDRDTPQVLADGVALQQAGGVLGLEEFSIGTMSAWGRDLAHLRPGSFMVGRRDWLVSKAVGKGPLEDGQILLEGPNRRPEMNYRIDGHATGYVSQFVARPSQAWQAVYTYPGGDRLWKLDPAVTTQFGRPEKRLLKDGWRRVASDKDSAWWVRQFALPAFQLVRSPAFRRLPAERPPKGGTTNDALLTRHDGLLPRTSLPIGGWLQRQYQTGDPALAAVFDNPYQDYLEVRVPAGIDPAQAGFEVTFFNARVEAVWRKAVEGSYNPGINAPGLAMLSFFRTMEARPTLETTAVTAGQPWQFGFLVPLGEAAPQLLMRMPASVDPNAEDPWKFTVVDDSLYVFLPGGDSPRQHSIEVACNSTSYMPHVAGSNSSFYDWEDAGPLRPEWPSVRVYHTEIDFGSNANEPLWINGEPVAASPGFEIDPTDASGRTLRLANEVRLGDATVGHVSNVPRHVENVPHVGGEKLLIFRYFEGDPRISQPREYRVSSKTLGPDRRVVLPTKPAAFPSRYAFFLAPAEQPTNLAEQMVWNSLRPAASRTGMAQGTFYYDAASHALYVCLFPGSEPAVTRWGGGRSDPFHTVRGLYVLGGNAYGHQKQYGWGAGLGAPADVYDDISVGFSPGHTLSTVPGSVVRDCTFRWAGADVGRGGEVSGDERHTADRIGRPELHVDHCVFDVSNAFLFDLNDNPTKNIPFANHHIWERSYFLPGLCGTQGPWWDQYCFNNVVQGCIFAGRGGVDVEVSENLIVRNNIFATDKGSSVTFRGSDRGYAINNTTFRGGGIWFHSEPERANATEQGTPCYGPSFPLIRRGPVPWLTIEPLRHEKGVNLDVRWIALEHQPEVYYCEPWDQPSPMLIDAKGFASYRAVGGLTEMARGTYYHDPAARRLYLRLADGSSPRSAAVPPPHVPQTEEVRRDLIYTLTVIRPGRLSIPHRVLSKTELEILDPLRPGQSVEVHYYDAVGHVSNVPRHVGNVPHDDGGKRVDRFAITTDILAQGRPRLRLSRQPADERLFVGLEGERPPLVRVTGSWSDVRPFEAELIPGGSILTSALMGMEFHVLKGHFPTLNQGDQFESVFHSRSIYHLASLNNVFLDVRSTVASDAMDNPYHGANYLLYSERSDASHSRIDYNCYWKDLQAVPGPLSAFIHWGKPIVSHSTAEKESITLAEFREKTGYEAHGTSPPSYFNLVANPLRFDFRPLPDSPLLGAGVPVQQQVGTFLFDPDEANGRRRLTFKGNDLDMLGQPRGERPTLGAVQNPLPGASAYYVAPDGKDSPDRGSRAAPWGSFAYSIARMRSGDLLVLLPGAYREPLVVNRSGTAQDFLHIVAENPPYPTPAKFPTRGPSVIDAAALAGQPAVLLDGCAHVRLAGLRVTGSRTGAAVELRGTRDCVVEYVFVDKSDGAGIRATGRGNTLYECQVNGGTAGYELAGSLADVRWCAAIGSQVGLRTIGPTAGLLVIQSRHVGHVSNVPGSRRLGLRPDPDSVGTESQPTCGTLETCPTSFEINAPASDVVLDGNWAESAECAYRIAGSRIMMVNNVAERTSVGIFASGADDLRIFNNSLLRSTRDGIVLGDRVRSALVLNNLIQADGRQLTIAGWQPAAAVWSDYNVFSRAQLPLGFQARAGDQPFQGLTAWTKTSGLDRNSRLAPLVYTKRQDSNGRWRIRQHAISVSNLTPHFNVGPLGANADPYTGGGTFILDVPENWNPQGDPGRRVWVFDTKPGEGALAARSHWYMARLDYRPRDGRRRTCELYRLDLPPEQIPPGTFCQDPATAKVFVRLPGGAEEPCPIGVHRKLSPQKAIGYYIGRLAAGSAEKYQGKLVTESLAKSMAQEGIQEIDTVANVLTAMCGSPTLEQGCPILGLCRDADGMQRPSAPLTMCGFNCWNAPGRFDVGASEHGYFVP